MALSKFFPFLEECSDKHFENTCLLGSGWFIYSGGEIVFPGSGGTAYSLVHGPAARIYVLSRDPRGRGLFLGALRPDTGPLSLPWAK